MKLSSKLIVLHAALATFAVVTSGITLYGVVMATHGAVVSFDQLVDQSSQVRRLRVESRAQLVYLHEIISGRGEASASYHARRDAFHSLLEEVAAFPPPLDRPSAWQSLSTLSQNLRSVSTECLQLVDIGKMDVARQVFEDRISSDIHEALDTRLAAIVMALDKKRKTSVDHIAATNFTMLGVVGLIGLACVAFVGGSAFLVRKWLLRPIAALQEGANHFASGNLAHRLDLESRDEFGTLANTLDVMAGSLANSQAKYRSLFENLRDSVLVCDPTGKIVECHDSDSHLLQVASRHVLGSQVSEAFPSFGSSVNWQSLIGQVSTDGEYIRSINIPFRLDDGQERLVDINAYPVDYSGTRYCAIVMRDATERNRLQKYERRAETMEAAETFARGIAHDFKNLLQTITTTLSVIQQHPDNHENDRLAAVAINACKQAASLSNRLLRFSCSDEGNPELINLNETLRIVLDALEAPFIDGVAIETDFADQVRVVIDRDHLTMIALNLLRNAQEAIAGSGKIKISSSSAMTSNPLNHMPPSRFGLLRVEDTGSGMPPEVQERMFEPLFSTKPRGAGGIRGLGLAFVYAAVQQAGGFIQIESNPGQGTAIDVFIPEDQGHLSSRPRKRRLLNSESEETQEQLERPPG